MNASSNLEDAARIDDASGGPTLQFRHDQRNSGVSRRGQLHPGNSLKIEYDPRRLPSEGGTILRDVICNVRYRPSGELHSGTLVREDGSVSQVARPLACEVRIPSGTTGVEIWFEGRGSTGTIGWDSRYGDNYLFPVTEDGLPIPECSVVLRTDSLIDANRIQVVQDAAFKEQIAIGASGARLRTGLVIRVRIDDPSASTVAWADLHIFDASEDLIHAGTIALEQAEPPTTNAELRFWDAEVYQGSGGASGMGVSARPDAHTIQYRLYCHIDDQIFTDGVLHQFDVPADTEVRAIPGGW